MSTGGSVFAEKLITQKGPERLMVLFWFQNAFRTAPLESVARIEMLQDTFRANRSDIAMVRLAVPLVEGDKDHATAKLVQDLAVRVDQGLAGTLMAPVGRLN